MPSTKKMDVPDIGGLLGQIAEKRHDLPKAPIQSVQPIAVKTEIRKNVKTAKHTNVKTDDDRVRGIGGRPSLKKEDIEYVKLSPRIPKPLKKRVEQALIDERYRDEEGAVITTMDEFVGLALERLLGNT